MASGLALFDTLVWVLVAVITIELARCNGAMVPEILAVVTGTVLGSGSLLFWQADSPINVIQEQVKC